MNMFKKLSVKTLKIINNAKEAIALPLLWQKKGELKTELNIRYGNNEDSLYDCYYLDDNKLKPIIFYIHGGGWLSGGKKLRRYYLYNYAKKGYFVVNIDYALAPDRKFPTQIHSILKVIERLIDEKDKRNIDVNSIILGGDSAGAYLASYLACMCARHELYAALKTEFKYEDSFKISALILISGAFDCFTLSAEDFDNLDDYMLSFFETEKIKTIEAKKLTSFYSVFRYIDEKYPPSIIISGDKDELIGQSEMLSSRLNTLGVEHIYLIAEGFLGKHAYSLLYKSKEGKRCLDASFEFLEKIVLNKQN